jgi:carbon storage regulator
MLVLTRRLGEEIIINGDIRIRVVAINKRQVRLGIAAPRSVRVARLELLEERSATPAGAATGETCEMRHASQP